MPSIRTLLLATLCATHAVSTPAVAEIYKWKTADGKLHFSDHRPLDIDAEQVNVRVNTYESPPEVVRLPSSPATGRVDRNQVVVYTTQRCGYCRQAKQYLAQHRVPFTEYDVETTEQGRKDYQSLQGRGVPIILVGDQRMNGFSENNLEGMLRGAGYRF